MKIQYLGTAAAEGIPALFCQCDLCTKARKLRGKNLRGRSGMILDDSLMIDFPPDMLMYVFNLNIDLAKISDILITHTHSDHFHSAQLMMRLPGCFCHIKEGSPTVTVHGNIQTGKVLEAAQDYEFGKKIDFVKFHPITKFSTFSIGSFEITPLPARHKPDEDAYIYLIKKHGKVLLYANDTGIFYDEVFAYFAQEQVHINFISFDCTNGKGCEGRSHMGMPDNAKVKERLLLQGTIDESTVCFVTHFSHNILQTHEDLEKEAQKYGFEVAYDGMILEF